MSSRLVLRVGPVLASAITLIGEGAFAQTTTRVSVDSNGVQGNANSLQSALSANGRFITFCSLGSNLVSGDTNNVQDVFVRDRLTGTTRRVSVDSAGVQGNSESSEAASSGDGRFIAFTSLANNLVAGDTNGVSDIFVRDRQLGTTERVSVGSAGSQGNFGSGLTGPSSISADGRFVAFKSDASNLASGDTNGHSDVFVRDRLLGATERISVDTSGAQGNSGSGASGLWISADGRYVAFGSNASNLVPGDTNGLLDIFLRDRQAGTTERLSVSSGGIQANDHTYYPSVSADGRYVTFESSANTLVLGDTNNAVDIFIRDRQAGTTERVSLDSTGAEANSACHGSVISADGCYVAFSSAAGNLAPGDTNGFPDVFLRDRIAGTTQRVSASSGWAQGDGYSTDPAISADGLFVSFTSISTNFVAGDTNGCWDTFVRDWTCNGAVTTYCTAKTNSLGCIPTIGFLGLPSQSGADNFYVTASNVLNNKLGMMLWATAPASNPFGGGTLCLHSPIVRTPAQMSGGSPTGSDCTGSYAYHFSQGYMIQQLLGAYTTVYAQWWSRDPGFAVPNNIGLTDGLSFTICP